MLKAGRSVRSSSALAGARQSPHDYIAERRHPDRGGERPREMRRAQGRDVRHRRHIQIIGEVALYIVADLAKRVIAEALAAVAQERARAGTLGKCLQERTHHLVCEQPACAPLVCQLVPEPHDLAHESRFAESLLASNFHSGTGRPV